MSRRIGLLAVLLGMMTVLAFAQNQERGTRRGRRGSDAGQPAGAGAEAGRRGGFDPTRMMNNIKEQMGASDDEWKTLQPKVEKTWNLQRDLRPFMAGMAGRPRGEGAGDQAENEVAKAQRELRTTLQDKNAPADDITKKLTALREAREKVRKELAAAQKDLKASANPRQEAVLALNGLLD